MKTRNAIEKNYINFSISEKKIANFVLENWDYVANASIKQLSHRVGVHPSMISKFFKKNNGEGFKGIKQELKNINSDYLNKLTPLAQEYKMTLAEDIINTVNNLNEGDIEKIVLQIKKHQEVVIFATGNTKILSEFFYFALITMGIKCQLVSSLYDVNSFVVKNKVVFIISMSGENKKAKRFLNLIEQDNTMTVAVTATSLCNMKNKINYHLHGYSNNLIALDTRAIPLNEKYIVQIIFDIIITKLYQRNIQAIDHRILQIKTDPL